ncbi:MAG: 4-(cytidine 5'-diphospho)-2-C-methyl-D-erythritol kinase, partial [Ferruginibacter sp.]
KPCLASGRGEILEEILLDLSPFKILLVYPGIIINTAWAFTQIIPKENVNIKLKELLQHPISTWQKNIVNDFETPVFNAHPEILKIKLLLYERGALYASLSGSGSSVFGIFPKDRVPVTNFPPHYFCRFA